MTANALSKAINARVATDSNIPKCEKSNKAARRLPEQAVRVIFTVSCVLYLMTNFTTNNPVIRSAIARLTSKMNILRWRNFLTKMTRLRMLAKTITKDSKENKTIHTLFVSDSIPGVNQDLAKLCNMNN